MDSNIDFIRMSSDFFQNALNVKGKRFKIIIYLIKYFLISK